VIVGLNIIEIGYINNTFLAGRMILEILPFTLGFAILLFLLLHRYADELFQKFIMAVGFLVILAALSPLISSLTNRMFAEPETIEPFPILKLSAFSQAPFGQLEGELMKVDGFKLEIKTDYGTKSFNLNDTTHLDIRDGIIYLPVRDGFLGFDYITHL
jgi:hypothetical protein